jgi:IS5 family transposase
MADKNKFRALMWPCKRRTLTDTAEAKSQDLIEMAKAHIRSKGESLSRVIKEQVSFQKTRLLRIHKKYHKIYILAAIAID